ncbi:ThiF family adenylyltransferase [Maridesulfovibrio frigidus]|uniref:ThiF family adenylyltransferase n=1 Tax=Maridesulfovibrio frigidus TaxID=340956 RepID=UPI0004E0C2A3|nr:ThiF family adenylyltransferase [Maridesulfovibrio frigidus]
MTDFLHRTRALLGQQALETLSRPLVTIAGLGGVGGPAFMTLVRSGVKRFRLAEQGIFDPPDMNRQWAALGSTMDRPKLAVYVEWAKSINPEIEIEEFPEGLTLENMDAFLLGSDIYIGAIDIDASKELMDRAVIILRKEKIPIFTSVACGFGTIMLNYDPCGMSPDEFWQKSAAQADEVSPFLFIAKDVFSHDLLTNIAKSFEPNKLATCAVGAGQAGLLVASEIIAYILKDTDYLEREIVFAPSFVILDLLSMKMEVKSILDYDPPHDPS